MLHPHEPTTQKKNKNKKPKQTKNLIELRARPRFRNRKTNAVAAVNTPHKIRSFVAYPVLPAVVAVVVFVMVLVQMCHNLPNSISNYTTFILPKPTNQQTTTTKKSASSDFDDDIDFDPDDLTILLHFFRKL